MQTLALIGGISWVATVGYYKHITQGISARLGGLNFARCMIIPLIPPSFMLKQWLNLHWVNCNFTRMTIAKRTLRTCRNGHQYYKSSDCPTCPVCEEERKPVFSVFSALAAPARRALENNGITTLRQLSTYTEQEMLQLHGIGKSSIPKLRAVLGEQDLSFKE